MRKNLKNYKWGIFYFNPKDQRLFVPKENIVMGWTLNFANIYSYIVIITILIPLILFAVGYPGFINPQKVAPLQGPSKSQQKIDPRIACESALAYTTFSSGKEADVFVKDCIDGKYPEVIKRYIKDMGLDVKAR